MANDDKLVQPEHWVKLIIPGKSGTDLGFHPHAHKYEAEVLQYFTATSRLRWYGSGRRVRPSEKGDILIETVWDFGVGDLDTAIKGFKAMFQERSFPHRTTLTKVTKHPDYSVTFEILFKWSGSDSE